MARSSFFSSRRLAAPLAQLTATAQAVASGLYEARAVVPADGEWRELALAFNQMLEVLSLNELRLRASERRYRDMLDPMERLALAYELDGRIGYCNDHVLRVSGWSQAQLLAEDGLERLLPAEAAAALLAALAARALPRHSETELVTHSGARRRIRWSHSMLRAPDGRIIGAASLGEDISAQHAAQRRADRLARFQHALTQVNRAIVRSQAPGELLDQVCRLCLGTGDITRAQIGLLDGTRLQPGGSAPAGPQPPAAPRHFDLDRPADAASPTGRALREGQPVICSDPQDGTLLLLPLQRAGQVNGVLSLLSADPEGFEAPLLELLTELADDLSFALAQRAGAAAQAGVASAERTRAELLARLSQQLRTPLNAVLGFAQLLGSDDPPLNPRQQSHLARIGAAGWQLLAQIEDSLDLASVDDGRLRLHLGLLDARTELDAAVAANEALARRQGIQLQTDYRQQELGAGLRGDALRLRQVLTQVISNAIRYNRPGGLVRLGLTTRDGMLQIHVEDQGMGMSAARLATLFEPLSRLGREQGLPQGEGVGMALSRQLMVLMGGGIEVRSQPGSGTQVIVSLPQDSTDGAALLDLPANAAPLRGRLLCIEDDPASALLLQQFLQRWPDLQLSIAGSGAEGLRLARQLQPELLLIEMRLPDMDGHSVLQALRADPATAALPAVMLSAAALPAEAARARQAGALDCWTLPLDLGRLEAALRRLLQQAR